MNLHAPERMTKEAFLGWVGEQGGRNLSQVSISNSFYRNWELRFRLRNSNRGVSR